MVLVCSAGIAVCINYSSATLVMNDVIDKILIRMPIVGGHTHVIHIHKCHTHTHIHTHTHTCTLKTVSLSSSPQKLFTQNSISTKKGMFLAHHYLLLLLLEVYMPHLGDPCIPSLVALACSYCSTLSATNCRRCCVCGGGVKGGFRKWFVYSGWMCVYD